MAQAIKNKISVRLLISLCLGALMPLGFAPWHHAWLVIVLFACQFSLLNTLSSKETYVAWLLFGLGFFGIGLLWTSHSIHVFGGMPKPFAMSLALLLALYCSSLLLLPLRVFKRLQCNHSLYFVTVFPSIWLISEILRSTFFTGFPWLLIGYAHTQSILKGWFAIGSAYLVTWLSLSISGLLYWLCKKNVSRRQRLQLALILALISGLSVLLTQTHWTQPTEKQLTITLVQGNTDVDLKWQQEHAMEIFAHYWHLTEPHLQPDQLIIWPETALTIPTPFSNPLLSSLAEKAHTNQTTLLIGVPHLYLTEQKFSNRLQMLGTHQGLYEKSHLLPFGDYIPFEKYLEPILTWLKLPMSDFQAGKPAEMPLTMGDWKLAPSICFEIAFTNPMRRISALSDFIITVSNDGWFGKTIGPWQHFQIATVRALENGRPVLRATNTGVTGIINADGQILASLPQFEATTLTQTLSGYHGKTPWQRFGYWPVLLFVALGIGVYSRRSRLHFKYFG
jgi:apolipoprotein N-acyltransferase